MRTLLRSIFGPPLPGRLGAAALLLRVIVGLAFLKHGGGKAQDLAQFAAEFELPLWMAYAATGAQYVSAWLLLAGLLTPFAGLTIASTMAVAMMKLIGRGETFVNPHGHSYEASAFYLVAGLTIALLGPGPLSLDQWWLGRLGPRPEASPAGGFASAAESGIR